MAKSEMFSPEEIAIIQTRQLRKTIYYIYDRSPFYRDLMDRHGIAPAALKSLDDLRYLPTTSRQDLIREGDRFLCVRPEEVVDISNVAAGQPEPLFYKYTEADLIRLAYNEHISLLVAGISEKDVIALALPLDGFSSTGLARYLGVRRLGAAVLRLGPVPPAECLRWLDRTRATAIIASPHYLRLVAAHAVAAGRSLPELVRKLICFGAPVRRGDFSRNEVGQKLADAWGAQLFSAYDCTEVSSTLCECEQGCGGHMHPELMHLEIVDEDGRSLPAGEIGEVCITPFGLTGMPVLRYRTGDWARLQSDPCACGRQTWRLGPVLRRRSERLRWQGAEIYATEIQEVLAAEPDVLSHLVVVEDGDENSDKVTVWLEVRQPESVARIRERLRTAAKIEPDLRLASSQDLQALQQDEPYCQPRVFLDRRRRAER